MTITEEIQKKVAALPEEFQRQVLDYLEFLSSKISDKKEHDEWSKFSVESALRNLEDEETSIYEKVSFKEKWQ